MSLSNRVTNTVRATFYFYDFHRDLDYVGIEVILSNNNNTLSCYSNFNKQDIGKESLEEYQDNNNIPHVLTFNSKEDAERLFTKDKLFKYVNEEDLINYRLKNLNEMRIKGK